VIRLPNPVRGSSFYKALGFKTLQKEEPLTGLGRPNHLPIAAAVFAFARSLAMGYKKREKWAKMKFLRSFNSGSFGNVYISIDI